MATIYNNGLPRPRKKVIEGGVDTSKDTVTADKMLEGVTAHDKDGQPIVGEIPTYPLDDKIEIVTADDVRFSTAGTYINKDLVISTKLQEKSSDKSEIVTADEGFAGLKFVDTSGAYEAGEAAGYADGHDAGYSKGYDEGEAKGFEDGKESQQSAFMYTFINNIQKSNVFSGAFAGTGWNINTFIPYQSLHMTGQCAYTFYVNKAAVDLVELFRSRGYEITFQNIANANNMFNASDFIRIPFVSLADNASVSNTFYSCQRLERIDGITSNETISWQSSTFGACGKLSYLRVEGTIAKGSFNVAYSPLDKASLTSIVNALSEATTGLTATLRLDAVNKAFETSEGAMDGSTSDEWLALAATKSNWTISLINS